MTIIEAIILGIIQGLTEFIPVSSSGHASLAQTLFGTNVDHLFLEFINIGTVIALLVYFGPKIIEMIKDIFVRKDWRLAKNIIISALPAGIIGFLLAHFIESSWFFGDPYVVAIALGLIGVVYIVLDRLPTLKSVKDGKDLTKSRALIIGATQVIALIPGVSRSGSTIIAGRLMGLSTAAATEYSFLLSAPIMLGVLVKLFSSATDRQYLVDNFTTIAVANLTSLIFGLLAVRFLMRYLAKHNLVVFGWYRIGLAAVVLICLLV